nr:MAG TPA_asm: hypothetical protein [Caudoviricetes sp.]
MRRVYKKQKQLLRVRVWRHRGAQGAVFGRGR